jgi:lipopolysaccharide/colanic/teichoic acid biosynthesis glycosyltransferase
MEQNLTNTGSDTTSNTSLALSNRGVAYGVAVGIEGAAGREAIVSESIWDSVRFYYGEYISGILFVLALFSYTFLMPVAITKPGKSVFSMIDKTLKKILDVLGAIIGLILTSPVFILLPLLIKLDSRGPVFYTQDRVGLNRRRRSRRTFRSEAGDERRARERRREDLLGRPFKVIKFRTMGQDAEKHSGPVWAIQNDSRVTRLGRILRKTRLDEVPQLINVLKGEMSLVGPRPERPFFVKDLAQKVPGYHIRLRVRPGITGLAQVNNGYDSSIDSVTNKVKNDITYIHTWSVWSDIKILMKTVVVVITGRGAC